MATHRTPPRPHRTPLDVQGAAEYLGVSVRQVRSLVFQRRLTHTKVGALVRFDPDVLDDYLAANTVEATG